MTWWFVVFPGQALGRRPWWARFLAPYHHHVYLCRPEGDATLVLEMLGLRLHADLVQIPHPQFLRARLDRPGAWVLAALASEDDRPLLRPPMTCVELVKAVLGISAWGVWTPRQLKRHLHRLGARPVLPLGDGYDQPVQ